MLHAGNVAAGIVIADQRHDTLRDALRNVHRHHVDFLADTDGSHRIRSVGGGEVVEDGHAGDVEQVLDGSRNTNRAHTGNDVAMEGELLGVDADVGLSALDQQQHKEVQAGDTVRDKGGKACTAGTHIQSPWEDEDWVKDDVEQAAAHCADACVHRSALRADQICHDHVEDGRNCAAADRPEHIGAGCLQRGSVRAQQHKQRLLENSA